MSQTQDRIDPGSANLTPPSLPRWFKVIGIVAVVVVLVIGAVMLKGVGGPHGPGRHMPTAQQSEHQP